MTLIFEQFSKIHSTCSVSTTVLILMPILAIGTRTASRLMILRRNLGTTTLDAMRHRAHCTCGSTVRGTDRSECRRTICFPVYNDSLVKRWYVKSSKANHPESIACEFNPIKGTATVLLLFGSRTSCVRFSAIPSPQSLRTDREDERIESKEESVRRVEDEPLALQCLVKPPIQAGDGSSALRWEYSDTNNDQDFQPINEDGVQVDGDTLKISQVKKTHRGYYRCKLNDHSLMVLLRVKGQCADA